MIYLIIALAICCINYLWWTGLVWRTKTELVRAEFEYEAYRTTKAHLRLCAFEVKLHRQQMWQGFWGIAGFVCAVIWGCTFYD